MKPYLNALKSGLKPLKHFISLKSLKLVVRPEILKIAEIRLAILKSGEEVPKRVGPSTLPFISKPEILCFTETIAEVYIVLLIIK